MLDTADNSVSTSVCTSAAAQAGAHDGRKLDHNDTITHHRDHAASDCECMNAFLS